MEGSYVPKLAELDVLDACILYNISEAPGVDAGLPSALGRITISQTIGNLFQFPSFCHRGKA